MKAVSIARALAKNPKLLLCDEPTGALDYNTGKQILALLQEQSRQNGIKEVSVDKAWVEKKLKRVRLKIDKDIDLYINEETYHDNSKFEIQRNGDGSINMIIKHVINYIEK